MRSFTLIILKLGVHYAVMSKLFLQRISITSYVSAVIVVDMSLYLSTRQLLMFYCYSLDGVL